MSRIIAYDLCRLFIGPYFATPRGIDRVDLAVAKHVFADANGPHIAILPTPLGVRAYPARTARLLLDHLQTLWRERAATTTDARLHRLLDDMQSSVTTNALPPLSESGLSRREVVRRSFGMLRQTGVSRGQPAVKAVPADAVYVNLGQLALAVPMFFNWLAQRPDVACALMIHDTIPLDHPELVKPASVAHHARMIATAAMHADCLIFSTAFAQASVNAALAKIRPHPISSLVRSLPVPAAFAEAGDRLPELADKQYFVVVSTIEPRKNFGLLVAVWARLVDALGWQAPHLVIVGAWGLNAEQILAPLAADPRLRARVHQVSGLSTPLLARLIAGCAALLSPSLAEGFGLPLLEGIAMGVPTIASDIPSHREIADRTTVLVGVDDRAGWEAAILAMPRVAQRRRLPIAIEMTEAAYCADIIAFVGSVASKAQSGNRPR